MSVSAAQIVAQLAIYVTTLLSLAALILIWFFYPTAYNYGQALGDAHFFFNTQRVGKLPDRSVSWRGDALLQVWPSCCSPLVSCTLPSCSRVPPCACTAN